MVGELLASASPRQRSATSRAAGILLASTVCRRRSSSYARRSALTFPAKAFGNRRTIGHRVCYVCATSSQNKSFGGIENAGEFLREKVAKTNSTFSDFAKAFSALARQTWVENDRSKEYWWLDRRHLDFRRAYPAGFGHRVAKRFEEACEANRWCHAAIRRCAAPGLLLLY